MVEKIRKQALHLQHWKCEEADLLYQYINEIEFGDATNREGMRRKFTLMLYLVWILPEVRKMLRMLR